MGERAKLSKQIGRDLRKNQGKRISAQKNPDGSSYTPRRKRLREQRGKIKRKMFTKLKNTAHLKLLSTADAIAIGFVGTCSTYCPSSSGRFKGSCRNVVHPVWLYPKRELLGFTDHDLN